MPHEYDETAETLRKRLKLDLALPDELSLPMVAVYVDHAIKNFDAAMQLQGTPLAQNRHGSDEAFDWR